MLDEQLDDLISEYYRVRYDPENITTDELNLFNEKIKQWIVKWKKIK